MNICSKIFAFFAFYFTLSLSFINLDNRVYSEEIEQFHISSQESLRYGKYLSKYPGLLEENIKGKLEEFIFSSQFQGGLWVS